MEEGGGAADVPVTPLPAPDGPPPNPAPKLVVFDKSPPPENKEDDAAPNVKVAKDDGRGGGGGIAAADPDDEDDENAALNEDLVFVSDVGTSLPPPRSNRDTGAEVVELTSPDTGLEALVVLAEVAATVEGGRGGGPKPKLPPTPPKLPPPKKLDPLDDALPKENGAGAGAEAGAEDGLEEAGAVEPREKVDEAGKEEEEEEEEEVGSEKDTGGLFVFLFLSSSSPLVSSPCCFRLSEVV